MIQDPTSQLWLPNSGAGGGGAISTFQRRDPKLGPAFGDWPGPFGSQTYNLPGGALLQFDLSRLTLADFRAMREHYQINVSLSILAFTMHQLDWTIESDNQEIAEFIASNLRKVWTRFIRAISQAYWAGYSPIALQFENNDLTGRVEVTKFKDLVPEACRVEFKKVKGWAPRGHPRPNRYIFNGINQDSSSYPIPVENSLWYPVLMENGDYGGRKLLRPAFAPWFFSQIMHIFSNRYFERFGEPVVVGRAPFDDDVVLPDGQALNGRDVMERIVSQVRNRAAVVLPADRTPTGRGDLHDFEYTIDYLESQMRGADFERYMQRLDEEMSLAMFLPVLLFRTADIGSYNLGQAHERLFFFMMNALAGDLKEYLDRFVLRKLVDVNFGEDAPDATFSWRKLGKDRDETLRAIAQAAIQASMVRPDLQELGQAIGMTFDEIVLMTGETGTPGVDATTQREFIDPNLDTAASARLVTSIMERIGGQAAKAIRQDKWDEFNPKLGFRRQMEIAVATETQQSEFEAFQTVESLYARVNRWIEDAVPVMEGDEFVERLTAVLEAEIGATVK